MLYFIAVLLIVNIALSAYRIPTIEKKTKQVFAKKPFVVEYVEEVEQEDVYNSLKSFGL